MRRAIYLVLLLLLFGCASKYKALVQQYQPPDVGKEPDYGLSFFWAAHPDKKDPSDSIPSALTGENRDTLADVFFIHPTTYTDKKLAPNADLLDAALNAKTDYSSILYQASVFNQHCRVFAPRYRQAHLSSFFLEPKKSKPIFDTAYADVKNAFDYYLKTQHGGRPLIIAGHSQGALLAERLLKEYFDGKPLENKLVAAYIIGWPIPKNYFEKLTVCSTAVQTGCFCGWRSFKVNYIPEYVRKEVVPSYVTNPLTWTTDNTYAERKLNKGSVLRNFNQLIPAVADAQIQQGVLWVNKPKFKGSIFFTRPNYHVADINLFYASLRQNVGDRIAAFLRK